MNHFVRSLIALLMLTLLAACGGAPAATTSPTAVPSESASAPAEPATAEPAPSMAAAFPVMIEHKYGSTTIPAAPTRVLSLGYTDQDAILALGVTPVAVRYWFGDETKAVFPWAQENINGAEPEVLNMPFGALTYEKIAALKPDLISGVYSGITQEEYELLSQIAPTIAQSGEYVDFGVPWQEMTRTVGRALGRAELAEELVIELEGQFTAVREQHPEWSGKSVVVGAPSGDGQYGFVASQDPRSRVFTTLGFEVPAAFDEIAGEQFYGTISLERTDLLERDLLVFHQLQWVEGGRAAIEADPILQRLNAMQDGRVVFIVGELDDALQFSTVLSLPFMLDRLVPMIEAALDGDPDTEVAAEALEGSPLPAAMVSPEATKAERVVKHAMGETTVPATPQRVVVLDTGELDSALTLGIKPVGAVEAIAGQGFPSYLKGVDGIATVGTIQEPNLERIAALEPDLILSSKLRHEQIYDQLSAIAPTVFAETTGVTWKENFELHAEAFGRTEAAELVKSEYQERVAEFQQAMGDGQAETEVSVVRFLPGDTRIYQKASFSGTVIEEAGLGRPPSQDVDEFAITNASTELIPEIGGDVIFVTVYGPKDETTQARIMSHALWQTLGAVQAGKVYEVSDDLWMLGIGYTAANGVIDDLTRYLVGPR